MFHKKTGCPVCLNSFMCHVLNKASDIWYFCEPGVPWPSLHYHAGVCVEPAKPKCSNEFLWPAEFPGALPALGSDGILTSAGELYYSGSFRYNHIAIVVIIYYCGDMLRPKRKWKVCLLVHSVLSKFYPLEVLLLAMCTSFWRTFSPTSQVVEGG